MSLFFGYSLADGFIYPYLVVWATQVLQAGDAQYGFLQATLTAGAAAGAIAISWLGGRHSLIKVTAITLILLGTLVMGLAINTIFIFALSLLFLFSLLRAAVGLPTTTLIQENAGDQTLGRVMGTYQSLGECAYIIAVALTAIAIAHVGVQYLFVLGGIIYFFCGILGLASLRQSESIPVAEACTDE